MTLTEQIKSYCKKYGDWIPSGSLQRMEFKSNKGSIFTPQTVGRTLRHLEESSILAVKYLGNKNHAHYKYIPDYIRNYYIPIVERNGEGLFREPEKVQALLTKYKR